MLRIAVFGAGGRTGKLVIAQALDRGHEVVAFLRSSERITAGYLGKGL